MTGHKPAMTTGLVNMLIDRSIANLASNPPSWMADLIKAVKEIKLSMAKLDKIEQTVNMISLKVSDLETQVNSMDIKVNKVEDSCKFISSVNDDRKKEL